MKKKAALTTEPACEKQDDRTLGEVEKVLLFTTKTCPNCRTAKAMLDSSKTGYEVIDAEENASMSEEYGILQAPTLVVAGKDGIEKFIGAGEIKKYTQR